MSYPAYAETKLSGVDWLGEVPRHWQIKRADGFLREGRNTVDPQSLDEPYVFHYSIPVIEATGDGQIEETAGLQSSKLLVEGGELLVAKLNPRKSRVLITRRHQETAVCSSEFIVLKPIDTDLSFACYLYLSEGVRQFLSASVESATRSHQRVGPEVISKMWCALPPLPEQQQIAAFLDRKTAELDAVLRLKERQLELLAEKRQALISQAVTRGIDPTAPRKPSGIPWLGDVPEQWEVKRLRYACRLNPFKSEVRQFSPETLVSFLPMEKVGTDGETELDENRMIEDVLQGFTYFRNGDIIIAKITPCFENGKGAIVSQLTNGLGFGSTEFHVLRSLWQTVPRFIYYLTKSHPFRSSGIASMYGAGGQKRVPEDFVEDFRAAFPPKEEQAAIVAHLDRETAQMDGIAQAVRTQIETVREYRQALISAAVTGKIDVRNV